MDIAALSETQLAEEGKFCERGSGLPLMSGRKHLNIISYYAPTITNSDEMKVKLL